MTGRQPGRQAGGTTAPVLLAVAHGTRDAEGPPVYRALLRRVGALRPGLDVRLAYLDLVQPSLADELARVPGPAVLVPLLLGTGYHIRTDIPAVVAATARTPVRLAPALGPDPLLADALADRLGRAGWGPGSAASGRPALRQATRDGVGCSQAVKPVLGRAGSGRSGVGGSDEAACGGDAVVLAAAGSTDPAVNADAVRMAEQLELRLGVPVVASYLCASGPTPAEAVARLRADGLRASVASYLMAPGFFARRAARTAGSLVSEPLGAHEAVARLVLRRYDAARRAF